MEKDLSGSRVPVCFTCSFPRKEEAAVLVFGVGRGFKMQPGPREMLGREAQPAGARVGLVQFLKCLLVLDISWDRS